MERKLLRQTWYTVIWVSVIREIPEKSGSEHTVKRELGESAECWYFIIQSKIKLAKVVPMPNFLVQQLSSHSRNKAGGSFSSW